MSVFKTLFIILVIFILQACSNYNNVDKSPSIIGGIVDNVTWYLDESTKVTDVNVTIPTGANSILCAPYNNTTEPLRPCTLADIDGDTDPFDTYEPELAVLFSTPSFIPSTTLPNAVLKQKGKSTRDTFQKSYKVKLDSKTILYKDERRLQFNKQAFDLTRMRNKLSFDLFEEIPNFTSLKTEFVHLGIDEEDKGLYTEIESYDKEYLLHRGWNKDDNLYKAQNFTFYLDPALTLNSVGKAKNLLAFSKVIEPQRGKKQTKLLEMLRAVNSDNSDINSVINKYFNRENYLTWLAINIILGNVDTTTQNFFLLNPLHSDKFYFLPWDYDDTFGWANQFGKTGFYSKWQLGYARWWDSPLHKKFLTMKSNRDDLDAMIYKLRTDYLTDSNIQEKIAKYKPLVRPYILSAPDVYYLPYTDSNLTKVAQEWEKECNRLTTSVQKNIDNYEAQKGDPMPFWQSFEYKDGVLTLLWDKSVDFEGDEIVYDVELADNYDFNNSIVDEKSLSVSNGDLVLSSYGEVSYSLASSIPLKTGDILYMRVTAKEKDDMNNTQVAFDSYQKPDNKFAHGVFRFELK